MVARNVIILLASIALVIAQIPTEFQANGYHSRPGPPLRVRQSGASKIFGWLGSRFAKIPYFLPRVPSFPKFAPQQELPQYQTVILPEPQSAGDQYYKGEEYPPVLQEPNNYIESNPSYNSPDQNPSNTPVENKPDQFEVVPSHMLSYEKEVMAPVDGGWQPGLGGIPTPPMYNNNPQGASQVPIVPQSVGPDYFNTAYGHEDSAGNPQPQDTYQQALENQQPQSGHQSQPNFQPPVQAQANQYQGQSYAQNNNLGATFGEIHQQLPQASYNLGSVSVPNGQQQSNQQNGFQSTSLDLNQADFSTLLSSINPSGQSFGDGYTVQSSQIVPVTTKAPKKAQGSQSKQQTNGFVSSGIPGVQILSQSEDGGNPVFEVLADADAPSFGGHPFDINKLIAMIEPGAELVDAPQLSESASETKNTYEEAPTTSGISDLLLSESQVEPSLTTVDGSKTKKPFSSFFSTNKNDSDKSKSSLKEIMEFFQQTGGKGYVVVEKKRSPQNLTDALTPDDDLTDGFSRLNITSETLPLLALEKEHDNSLKFGIIQRGSNTEFSKAKSTTSSPTKTYSFKPSGQSKPFLPKVTRQPIKFENLTSPTVFFAVRATTQHPNHNYNSNSSFRFPVGKEELKAEIPPVNILLDTISKPTLDAITGSPEIDYDLSAAESSQVKVIAITVTPPPNLKPSNTTPTPTASPLFSIPVTKKSVSSSSSSKKRPAPVYRRKIAAVSNRTVS